MTRLRIGDRVTVEDEDKFGLIRFGEVVHPELYSGRRPTGYPTIVVQLDDPRPLRPSLFGQTDEQNTRIAVFPAVYVLPWPSPNAGEQLLPAGEYRRNTGRPLANCGTPAAYRRHLRHNEEPCQTCRNAQAADVARYPSSSRRNRRKASA